MTKTEAALHLVRCTRVNIDAPAARLLIPAGLAEVKRGQVRLTPAGHAVLRGK